MFFGLILISIINCIFHMCVCATYFDFLIIYPLAIRSLSIFLFLFLAMLGLPRCVNFIQFWRVGATLWPPCMVSSLWWLVVLWSTGSRVHGLQSLHLLGSRAQTQSLCHKGLVAAWHLCHLPGSGREHVSPALAGRFFTTEPPGKPSHQVLLLLLFLPVTPQDECL